MLRNLPRLTEMAEPTILRVVWKGTVPGLTENRISVGAFGDPLTYLLRALRRIANTFVTQALGGSASSLGRLPDEARQLDIELTTLVSGSGGLEGVITINTPPGDTFPLFDDLPERCAFELMDAIDQERKGNLRNEQVRAYLKSLPVGVTHQTYALVRKNGSIRREVSFSVADLAAEVFGLPFLMEIVGRVIGVGFDPGRYQVRFLIETGQEMTVASSSRQVEFALENRAVPVRALILVQPESRKLLRLQLEHEPRVRLNHKTFIFDRWDELLRRLAE